MSNQGSQFRHDYSDWCVDHDVVPRFGAIGSKGSIALVERFIRTLKAEGLRCMLIPMTRAAINREPELFTRWFNACWQP